MSKLLRRPVVLWWSCAGREYSRDRVVRCAFRALGWEIVDFVPTLSRFGHLEASLRRIPTPDLVWVPCFRQRNVLSAQLWADRRKVPLIFDPLISAYDKQVFERKKFAPETSRARRLLLWESNLLKRCSLVIADTGCHAEFFERTLSVSRDRLSVIPVGAEDEVFRWSPLPKNSGEAVQVLFYGTFIALQGADVIARAALQVESVQWTFLGQGPMLAECQHLLRHCPHVRFLPLVPYEKLPDFIAAAHILLGVFSPSEKASRVIPNKVYQALAVGRPVVTQKSDAYPAALTEMPASRSGMTFVEAGSPEQLAGAVRELAAAPERLAELAVCARATYEKFFQSEVIRESLADSLARVISEVRP